MSSLFATAIAGYLLTTDSTSAIIATQRWCDRPFYYNADTKSLLHGALFLLRRWCLLTVPSHCGNLVTPSEIWSNYALEEVNDMKKLLVRSLTISLLAFLLANSVALGQGPPGPTIASAATASVGNISGEYDLINAILDFAPGAAMPSHTHGGLTLVTVLEGELTNAFEGQAAQVFRAGENWIERPGHLALHSAGASAARASVVFLLPKGAELTTMAGAGGIGMPRTGGRDMENWLLLLITLGLLFTALGAVTRTRVRVWH